MNYKLSFFATKALGYAVIVCCAATAAAAGGPTVYSSPSGEQDRPTRSVQEAFGDRVTVAPVPASARFTPAKFTKRMVHPYIREAGRVTIAAVADAKGRLRDPVVLESTNPRLNILMRDSVKNWGCVPARLNGTPVASVLQTTIVVRRRQPIQIY